MASALEVNFNYTYPGILPLEVFFKPTEDTPALSDMFIIDQGISHSKRYNLLNQLSKILKPYRGCERQFTGTGTITNTTLITKEHEVGLEWCKDDFTQQLSGLYNILAQEYLKTGNQSFDPSGTPINTIITQLIEDAIRRDVFRKVCFAAQDDADEDWNQIDGLITRLIDTSGGSNYCVRRASTDIGTLTAGLALTALKACYEESANILKAIPNSKKEFWVTGSVYENLLTSYESNSTGSDMQFSLLMKGPSGQLQYRGINVTPIYFWDTLLEDTTNPWYGTLSNLIIYTTKENHYLGVESTADLNKIEGWYERKDRKYYFEGNMKFGYQYLHCDLQTIAY